MSSSYSALHILQKGTRVYLEEKRFWVSIKTTIYDGNKIHRFGSRSDILDSECQDLNFEFTWIASYEIFPSLNMF